MRRILFLLLITTALSGLLCAQRITVNCSPSEVLVNTLRTSSFDPVFPQNQPKLTEVTFTNDSPNPVYYTVQVMIKWNNIMLIDVNFSSLQPLPALPDANSRTYSNRDLVSNQAGDFFGAPSGEISVSRIMDAHNTLRGALQSGYFPDGNLEFTFTATPTTTWDGKKIINPKSSSATFTVRIRNIDAIFLTYPGNPLGQTPVPLSLTPVTFLWNSINPANNNFRLVIKEFVQSNPPNLNSVETGGRKVFDEIVNDNTFTNSRPFLDNHFYAWQVSMPLFDENDPFVPAGKSESQSNVLKSEWFAFKYVSDSDAENYAHSLLRAILNSLNNNEINNVFAQGYDVTGAVFYEGRVYSGNEAVDLVKTLIGKEIIVNVTDN